MSKSKSKWVTCKLCAGMGELRHGGVCSDCDGMGEIERDSETHRLQSQVKYKPRNRRSLPPEED